MEGVLSRFRSGKSPARQQRDNISLQSMSTNSRKRRRSHTSSHSIPPKCVVLIVIVFLVAVVMICLHHLRHDLLFQDVVAEVLPAEWLVDPEETQLEALEKGRAILRGGLHEGGILHDRPFVDHEIKALVDGEDQDPDGGLQVDEQDEAWQQVQKVFDKNDAKMQSQWWNAHNIVHVVHTRCLQNQPRLLDYTKARLDQFMAFTLPSFQHQTNDEFLWIIWTDPSLVAETEDKLSALVKVLPNVAVIGWKKNRPDIRSEWFRETFDQSFLVSGSYKLLMSYHQAAQSNIVLDTYIDSDDAISSDFIQTLQDEAAQALSPPKAYRFWCPSYAIEWGFFSPDWQIRMLKEQKFLEQQALQAQKEGKTALLMSEMAAVPSNATANVTIMEKGYFTTKHATDKCMSSAGSTVGLSAKATIANDFPIFLQLKDRDVWHQTVMPCDEKGEANCLGFMTNSKAGGDEHNEATPSYQKAILVQSKTVTAATTKTIRQVFPKRPKPSVEAAFELQESIWRSMHGTFGIDQGHIEDFRLDFRSNMDKILLDMLTICLPSNACKVENKKLLQELLTSVGLKKSASAEDVVP